MLVKAGDGLAGVWCGCGREEGIKLAESGDIDELALLEEGATVIGGSETSLSNDIKSFSSSSFES
jgi:hypothetical protein